MAALLRGELTPDDPVSTRLSVVVRAGVLACVGLAALAGAAGRPALASEVLREEAKRLYQPVPDVALRLTDGSTARLADYSSRRPVLLALFYRRCTGTCSPFLRSLAAAVTSAGGLGERYDVITVSFDPRDSLADVREMQEAFGLQDTPGWTMAVSDADSIRRLTDAVGFWYRPDATGEQFDHPSLVAAVRDGRIVSVVLDNAPSPARLRDLLNETRGVFVPYAAVPGDDTLFRCFQVDEATGALRPDWGMLLLALPAVIALAATGVVFGSPKRTGATWQGHGGSPPSGGG